MGRYNSSPIINRGTSRGAPRAVTRLREAHSKGLIKTTAIIIGSATRLDHAAFQYLGDPSYWWAIAALSDIGWALQVPAETRLIIPSDLDEIKGYE